MNIFQTAWSHIRNMWRSFTIWFNAIMAAFLLGAPTLMEQLPSLSTYIPADVYKNAMLIAIIGNIILRFKTTTSLAGKTP